jgi:hypothetical protein
MLTKRQLLLSTAALHIIKPHPPLAAAQLVHRLLPPPPKKIRKKIRKKNEASATALLEISAVVLTRGLSRHAHLLKVY